MLTDFSLFKQHVRADDFDDDDAYLRHLLEAAEEAVVRATNRTAAELVARGGGQLPRALSVAAFSLAAHWYNQREAVASVQMVEVPATLTALIRPHQRLCSQDE